MMKKINGVKRVWLLAVAFNIFLVVCVGIIDWLPENTKVTYVNKELIFESWKFIVYDAWGWLFVIPIVMFIIMVAVSLRGIKQNKLRGGIKIVLSVFICLVSLLVVVFTYIALVGWGQWEDNDSKCYEFSNAERKIVICESSYLLAGWGDIYLIEEDNSAHWLAHFSTDDGGRNEGEYELEWKKDGVEVTYDVCSGLSEPVYNTIYVKFAY